MHKSGMIMLLAIVAVAALATACAEIDPIGAQAQTGAPVAAQVEVVQIPYNPSLPRYVVAVLPLDYGASSITSGGGPDRGAPTVNGGALSVVSGGVHERGMANSGAQPGFQVGAGMAAQLTTALTRAGNIAVIEPSMLREQPDGSYTCKLQPGEVGPFVLKGTVTEFNETAQADESTRGGSLGGVGAVMGIAGAVAGKPGLGWTGAGIAAANPSYQNSKMKRSGMVGMDLQLVDGRSGRIVRGMPCQGTFTTVSATSGMSLFGIGGGDAKFASSALGQATRAAMNDAVQQTVNALIAAPR